MERQGRSPRKCRKHRLPHAVYGMKITSIKTKFFTLRKDKFKEIKVFKNGKKTFGNLHVL